MTDTPTWDPKSKCKADGPDGPNYGKFHNPVMGWQEVDGKRIPRYTCSFCGAWLAYMGDVI